MAAMKIWAATAILTLFSLGCVLGLDNANNFTVCSSDPNCTYLECNSSTQTHQFCHGGADIAVVICSGSVPLNLSCIETSNDLHLIIKSCNFAYLREEAFAKLPHLAALQFMDCENLKQIDSRAFTGHESHLKSLRFSNCDVHNFTTQTLENFQHLTTFSLENNRSPITFFYQEANGAPLNLTFETPKLKNESVDVNSNSTANNDTTGIPTNPSNNSQFNSTIVVFLNGTKIADNETSEDFTPTRASDHFEFEQKTLYIVITVLAIMLVLCIAPLGYCIFQRR